MPTVSLSDLEPTIPAPPPGPKPAFSRNQWTLLAANHALPLLLLASLALARHPSAAALFSGSAGYLVLAGIWGGLTASVASMLGLFVLSNRAAPIGKSTPRFRAFCLFLVWAMTTVVFTAPLCAAVYYGRTLVASLLAG